MMKGKSVAQEIQLTRIAYKSIESKKNVEKKRSEKPEHWATIERQFGTEKLKIAIRCIVCLGRDYIVHTHTQNAREKRIKEKGTKHTQKDICISNACSFGETVKARSSSSHCMLSWVLVRFWYQQFSGEEITRPIRIALRIALSYTHSVCVCVCGSLSVSLRKYLFLRIALNSVHAVDGYGFVIVSCSLFSSSVCVLFVCICL